MNHQTKTFIYKGTKQFSWCYFDKCRVTEDVSHQVVW